MVATASGAAASPGRCHQPTSRGCRPGGHVRGSSRDQFGRFSHHQSGASLDGFRTLPAVVLAPPHATPEGLERILRRKGWSPDYQFPYLDKLWERESGWNVHAENPYSGAYGIRRLSPTPR